MGLLGDWLGSKRMEDPVRGTAQVVGATPSPDGATHGTCRLTLVVNADGVPATPIEHRQIAPTAKWPQPGQSLPVTVDRADPERLRVEWDEVASSSDVAWQQAQQLAGGDQPLPSGFPEGTVTSVTVDGRELDDATRQQLAAMGVDIDAILQQAQAMGQAYAGDAPEGSGPADEGDLTAQLERLARLRDQAALSEEEFAQAKRRLLEGG